MVNQIQKIFKSPNGSIFHHTITSPDGRILSRPFETHDQYEILYLISGKVSYQIEGRRYNPEPGDIILVGIGELHNLIVDLSVPYERVVMHFDESILPKEFSEFGEIFAPLRNSNGKRLIKKEELRGSKVEEIYGRVINILEEDQYTWPLLISASIDLLVELNKITGESSKGKVEVPNSTIKQATEYINSHLEERLSLDDIANAVFLNKFYLSRTFKKEMGVSLMDYVIRKKMHYAQRLILSGFSAQEAADKIGYANYSSFFYSYKKVFGYSPKEKRGER